MDTKLCKKCKESKPTVEFSRNPHYSDGFNWQCKLCHKWSRVEKEISKCVVLCSNCHRKLHAGLVTIKSG